MSIYYINIYIYIYYYIYIYHIHTYICICIIYLYIYICIYIYIIYIYIYLKKPLRMVASQKTSLSLYLKSGCILYAFYNVFSILK